MGFSRLNCGYLLNITLVVLRESSLSEAIWHKNLSSKGILLIGFTPEKILSDRNWVASLVIALFTFSQQLLERQSTVLLPFIFFPSLNTNIPTKVILLLLLDFQV